MMPCVFGWAKVADKPSVAKMCAERVSGIAEDSGTEKLMQRESGVLRKAVQSVFEVEMVQPS